MPWTASDWINHICVMGFWITLIVLILKDWK